MDVSPEEPGSASSSSICSEREPVGIIGSCGMGFYGSYVLTAAANQPSVSKHWREHTTL